MKIVCAGFWKTGTKSLAEALTILGYKVYDYDQQVEFLDLFEKFYKGTVTDEDIRETLKDVDVVIDGQAIALWEHIYKAIPGTKVILTTRDDDSWWKSFKSQGDKMPISWRIAMFLLMFVPSGWRLMKCTIGGLNLCVPIEGPYAIPLMKMPSNERLYKMKFRQHNSYVLETVPDKDLLVFPVGENKWEPLCEFLGVDVPDVPYPHKNKAAAFMTTEKRPLTPPVKRMFYEMLIMFSIFVAICACLIYYLVT
uniref:uncharacterized protein LOC120337497 n=1 Tax=Styela clava TaxID=7725 RepID=UPI0019398894|nr:uncharacterized protein LOC120337497 [Styela clava]